MPFIVKTVTIGTHLVVGFFLPGIILGACHRLPLLSVLTRPDPIAQMRPKMW